MFVVLLVLLLSSFVSSRQDADYFPILKAKCAASCWKNLTKPICITQCLKNRATWIKPGQCPDPKSQEGLARDGEQEDVFSLACLDACQYDAECEYINKCCPNSCGITCQPALDLDRLIELPPRPKDLNITYKKKSQGKGIILRWNMDGENEEYISDGSVVYVLESRSHVGRHFSSLRLSDWSKGPFDLDGNQTLNGLRLKGLKVGYWYQFRVATVNELGSRGFSEPSEPFTLPTDPKPPPTPDDIRVEPLTSRNNESPRWILRWNQPDVTDLPIERYKVFWSKRISPGSVLVRHVTVLGDTTSYVLKELQPNALYFLQVQALCQYGKDRLKSEKAAIVLNTTLTAVGRKRRNHHRRHY